MPDGVKFGLIIPWSWVRIPAGPDFHLAQGSRRFAPRTARPKPVRGFSVTISRMSNPNDLDTAPDSALTPEQEAVARGLSQEVFLRIDAAILSHARAPRRKVAMIIGLVLMDQSLGTLGLPDLFYAGRIKALVAQGRLVTYGNLAHMRYSEVRLP